MKLPSRYILLFTVVALAPSRLFGREETSFQESDTPTTNLSVEDRTSGGKINWQGCI